MSRELEESIAEALVALQDLDDLLAGVAARASARSARARRDQGIEALEQRRSVLVESVPQPWRGRYERLRHRHGRAIVMVEGKVCMGCSVILPEAAVRYPVLVHTLTSCDCCGRLLHWKPTDSP